MPAAIDIRLSRRDSFVTDTNNSLAMSYTWNNSFKADHVFMEYFHPPPPPVFLSLRSLEEHVILRVSV
jgi:hypothetical protein